MAFDNTTNLIINYLPQTLTDEEFRSMFLSIGQLKSSKVVRDRATGYSYGFGFVEFGSEDDAMRAIQTLNGLQLQNKRIKVAYSRSGESIKGANLYISNINKNINQTQLEEMFTDFGNIIQCRILMDQGTGRSKGVGFVLYNDRSEAEEAIKTMNGHCPPGFTESLSVKYADDNKGKARAPPNMDGGVPTRGGRGGRGGRGRGRGGGGGFQQNNFNNGGGMGGGFGGSLGSGFGGSLGGGGGLGDVGYGGGYGDDGSYDEFGGGYGDECDVGFGSGYGMGAGGGIMGGRGRGARGGRGANMNGRGGGGGYGPMRNQTRMNRFNPMGSSNFNAGAAAGAGAGGGGLTGGGEDGGFILFVYNIGPSADESEVWQLFSPFGTIQKVNVIRDHAKNQGKGYAFVTMTSYQEAMQAVQQLNGYRYVGKPLQVSFKSDKQ